MTKPVQLNMLKVDQVHEAAHIHMQYIGIYLAQSLDVAAHNM